ncbi:MAG: type II toxin-antitoxin system VapC family toxin [Aphanothece sp. CMT-3BRIN-NPC111]|nr:type II toxin-antitoxin system VapC family toxin [Aphanothece sp. CMT-3BRIN-NPC111]
MSSFILDASALLAYLNDEVGAIVVENALIEGTYISIVNWAEVLSKVADIGENPEALALQLENEGLLGNNLQILPLTEEDALVIAQSRPLTKTVGLSFGDRACLALGKRLGLPVLTADRSWASLTLGVLVNLIR